MSRILLKSTMAVAGLTAISGVIMTSSVHADDATDEVVVSVPISCTIRATGNNSHTAEINNGTYTADIGTTNIKAVCNDASGFAIYAAGYTGNEINGANSTKLMGSSTGSYITTGTATGSNTNDPSNWAMKLAAVTNPTPTYPVIISGSSSDSNRQSGDPDFSGYTAVPSNYTKVAYRASGTDTGTNASGANITTTYAAFINTSQLADTYTGKVIYTLVHPASEIAAGPQTTASGKICYYANTTTAEGTMGCQTVSTSATTAKLFASNFNRTGYGFAGWSDAYNYATNANAHFYGPNEEITFTAGQYTGNNSGLSLYAIWVKSAGEFQDTEKVAALCNANTGSLTAAVYNDEGDSDESTWSIGAGMSSISALTDTRDNQTYAIAKLSDGKCWMIENLRLDNTAELTILNTNNPLNDGTNVTIKHNYTDTNTYNTLSASSNTVYNESTAPNGWCTTASAACYDQSRIRTDNTADRVTYSSDQTMPSGDANFYSYGNYYNWYSATAGRGTYGIGRGVVTTGDVCPFGWHLPTGYNTGEYAMLSISLGGLQNNGTSQQMNSSTSPTSTIITRRFTHFPNNFNYSGTTSGYNNATINSRGTYGNYWTATSDMDRSYTDAYGFGVGSTASNPGSGTNYKHVGWAVRCMAQSET